MLAGGVAHTGTERARQANTMAEHGIDVRRYVSLLIPNKSAVAVVLLIEIAAPQVRSLSLCPCFFGHAMTQSFRLLLSNCQSTAIASNFL